MIDVDEKLTVKTFNDIEHVFYLMPEDSQFVVATFYDIDDAIMVRDLWNNRAEIMKVLNEYADYLRDSALNRSDENDARKLIKQLEGNDA